MQGLRRKFLAAVMVLFASSALAFGQSPQHKRVDYSINVTHELEMGGYVIPAGKYVLMQVNTTDPNTFALHPKDLTNEPIAIVRTVRDTGTTDRTPEDASISLEIDESSDGALPVLRGWTIPGEDPFEIVSVTVDDDSILVRAD